MPKNESFGSYLKDLKLSTFSDIWTIDKTHNKFLAHELQMNFKLLNFARKLFLMLLKNTLPLLWKIYIYENILYPNNLCLEKISWNERICGIESRFKIVT